MTNLTLTMHPGSDGDALALRWGPDGAPRNAVIDLGRTADYLALRDGLVATGGIDLLVFTHIDADHIEGAMPLVAEATPPFAAGDVWYNGHAHLTTARKRLEQPEILSVNQGEKLSAGIIKFKWPWNSAFAGGPVSLGSPEGKAPIDLHGLQITLLSPDDEGLSALKTDWDKELAAAAMRAGDPAEAPPTPEGMERLSLLDVEALARRPFKPDRTKPNGSSIAFLAEYDGRRVLMAADAHPDVLVASLRAMHFTPENRLPLHMFKLSHHGSKANLSPELLSLIDCTRFAISTDGSRHHFPDPETISRILVADPLREKTFYFNYRQENAATWAADPDLGAKWKFKIVTPDDGETGLAIDV